MLSQIHESFPYKRSNRFTSIHENIAGNYIPSNLKNESLIIVKAQIIQPNSAKSLYQNYI